MTKTGNGSAEKELKNKIRQIHNFFFADFHAYYTDITHYANEGEI